MAECGELICLSFSRNVSAADIRFDVVDVDALLLAAVVCNNCSLSSLSLLISLLTVFDDWLLDNCITDDCLLPSECCKLLMRSRNDTFGLDGIALALDAIRLATTLVVVFADAFNVPIMVLAATESLIVGTFCVGLCNKSISIAF